MRGLVVLPVAAAVACSDTTPVGGLVLTVEGNGRVSSEPPGFGCDPNGGTCTIDRQVSEPVVLMATTTSVSAVFSGWTGACVGTEPCRISGLEDVDIHARFVDQSYRLRVNNLGYGAFEVRSQPAGVVCGTAPTATRCEVLMPANIDVTLSATWGDGVFVGWHEPGCGTSSACTVHMGENRTVTPEFNIYLMLQVARAGSGSGIITGTGINCGSDCFDHSTLGGDTVTLHAEPVAGSRFVGWSSPCPEPTNPDCTFQLQKHTSLEATFDLL